MISWVAAQFLYANASLLGHPVTVTTTSNHVYEGILHTVNPNPKDGYSVVLKHARKIKVGTNSPNSSTNNLSSSAAIPTLIITGKDFGMMTAKNITVNEEVSKRNKKGFQTDTAISGAKGTKERELQKWVPDPSVDTMLGLEDSTDGPWDQFAANESKFGLTTDYDEEIYTTPLNRESEDYKKRVKEAERIAREIEQSSATNVHVLEERGHELDDNIIDEEDRYGAVVRKPTALVQPPTRKQAPSSRPLRTSSFESRSTLSSSAGAAPVTAAAAKDTGKLGDVKSGDKMFNQSMSSLDKKKQGFPLTKNASENPVSRVTLLEPVMQKTSTLPPTKDSSSQPSQTTKYKPIEQTAIDRFNKYSESEKAAKDKASRDKVKRPPKAIPVVPKVPQSSIPEKRDEILAQFKEFSQTFKLKSECPDEIKTMFAKAKKDESDENQKKSEADESEKSRTSEKTEEAKKKKADQTEKAKAGEKKDKAESKSFSFNLDAPAFVPSFTPSTSTTTTALPSPSSTSPANTPGSTYKVPPSPKYKGGYRGNREKRTGFFAGKELNREPVSIKKILKKTLERAMKPKDVAVSWPYGQPGRGYRSFFNAQPPPQDMGGYYNQGYPPAPTNYYYQQQQPTYPARGVPTTYSHMMPPPNVGAPLPPHMHNVPPYPGSPGMVPTNVNAGPVAVGPSDYPHLHNVPPYPGVHNVPPPHIHSNTSGHTHNAPPYPQVHNNSSKPPRTPTSATAPSHFPTPSQQPPPQHMPPHAQHPIPQHPGAPMPVPAPHYPPQSMPPHVPGQVPVPGMMPPNVPPHFYPPPPGPHQHGSNYPPPMYPQSYGPLPPNPNVVNGNGGGSQASQE